MAERTFLLAIVCVAVGLRPGSFQRVGPDEPMIGSLTAQSKMLAMLFRESLPHVHFCQQTASPASGFGHS
jgi:hypothetical protein